MGSKLKPPHHWERQVAKYERKLAGAATPTQRIYALRMKQAAEKSLAASRGGTEPIVEADVVDLGAGDYREL